MELLNKLMSTSNDAVKILDDHKDIILLGAGLTAGLGTVITASRATLKAKDILKDYKMNHNAINTCCDVVEGYSGSNDHKTDVVMNVIVTGGQIAKVYAPSIVLGATSVACLVGEHCVMQKRVNNLEKTVASLSAAYIAVDTAFKKYRKRVVEKYGEEEDRKLRLDIHEETVEETDEKGKTKKVKKQYVNENFDKDKFTIIWNGDNHNRSFMWKDPMKYKPDWDANTRIALGIENMLNDRLPHTKKVYWSEVLEEFDIKVDEDDDDGQIYGWTLDPNDPLNLNRKIKLGINDPVNRRLLNGTEEECMILQPNIDGIIVDLSKYIK